MEAGDQLRIGVRHGAARVILSLDGELDMATAELLERAIEDVDLDGITTVVLDLERLQFMDSTGLRIVLSAHERCRQRGLGLALTPGSQQVQRLLSVTGVAQHLQIIAAPDEIVA
jgi:anti-sigma B factor antagonist